MSEAAGGAAAAVPTGAAVSELRRRQVRWSLLFGNFVIGCGVMVVVGTLTDISRSLDVSVAVAGQLITVAAVVMCFGAPLLAGWVGGLDRRNAGNRRSGRTGRGRDAQWRTLSASGLTMFVGLPSMKLTTFSKAARK